VSARDVERVTHNLARLVRLFDDHLSIPVLRRACAGAAADLGSKREGGVGGERDHSSARGQCPQREAGEGGEAREGGGGGVGEGEGEGEEAAGEGEEVPVGLCSSDLQEFLDGGGVGIR
jgi:hypothetical protein